MKLIPLVAESDLNDEPGSGIYMHPELPVLVSLMDIITVQYSTSTSLVGKAYRIISWDLNQQPRGSHSYRQFQKRD